jgi:hypothetical protein
MPKTLTLIPFVLSLLSACQNDKKALVDPVFADSLITHFTLPADTKNREAEMQFWKSRIDPKNPGMVNEAKYAASLVARFHQSGDIGDVKMADSIVRAIDTLFNFKEAGPKLTLVSLSIMQHRFSLADSFLQQAKTIGLRRYEWLTALFDVSFEIGRYDNAQISLNQLRREADYGYYFRRSRMDHLNGGLDSSISAMMNAADLAENSEFLKRVALSNTADLYMHAGKLAQARDLYMQCIRMNSTDFHSIMGLGWIASVHDHNDSLATRIFRLVESRNQLPDALFKLSQVADRAGDSVEQKKYAAAFADRATDPVYGNMYNRYLIEFYTGILQDPARADELSARELSNRATPQTYAWRVWTLFATGKKEEAYSLFQKEVSGKPLEGLELYYMGKMMQGLEKGYNAGEFFKAAYKNKYDLSPGIVKDIETQMKES